MKRVVLLGGGHAHVHLLAALARQRLAGAEAVLVTPFPRQMYSGMVPGLVAGHYTVDDCVIPLAPLAAAGGVRLVESQAVRLDAGARCVHLADGRVAEYDVLSIDSGSAMDRDRIPGAREHGLFLRPIEHFVRLVDGLWPLAGERVLDIVVVGGGAAGVEVALALQHRLCLQGEERARVALVSGGGPPLAGYPERVIERAQRVLARRRITVFPDRCAAIERTAVLLASGARLACDAPVLATGSEAPPFLHGSRLALDEQGYIRTSATLQSLSHPEVLAAGDVASRGDAPHAKSGVYAVRAGPALALNLRRLVGGGAMLDHQPPRHALNIVSCGARFAIATRGSWSAEGRWVWWWKNHLDRSFVRRYRAAAAIPSA